MKQIIGIIIASVLSAVVISGCSKKNKSTQDSEGVGIHHAQIEVRDYGVIQVELDGDTAPVTVRNFMKLAGEGFYDGLTFHRIISGFMIQGGDPKGNGTGGSDETIKGEFSDNGVKNDISHVRGVISMARSSNMDSASSQFFIVQADSTYLDGQYAAFGHVTEGMEIVDQICEETAVQDGNGTVAPADQPVIAGITILD
ncbi:MAG: peptidylprolyl isomerase [Candidatus Limivivens sp.]|nr:peptidylprolyl isomerase [Candidatus Limivivens sp.]